MQRSAPAPAVNPVPAPPPSSSSRPAATPESGSRPTEQERQQRNETAPDAPSAAGSASFDGDAKVDRDYTKVPQELESKFEEYDLGDALRPTIINPGSTWTKKMQKALLAAPEVKTLGADEQRTEKDAAFDLLDALTKSGALTLDHASLHVVVAATHCFDKTVLETVVQDNTNPIDRVERSSLIMASTVHKKPVTALLNQAQRQRVIEASPMLCLSEGA